MTRHASPTGIPFARRALTTTPPWLIEIAAMLLVQLSNALSVAVIEQVGPAGTAWLRMCFGALLLWLVVRPSLRSVRTKDVPALLVLGLVTGFMTMFFLGALARIPLGTAVAVEFLGPLTVAALASRRPSALAWPVLALTGVVLLTEPWQGRADLVGIGFALAAGACWGLYNVFTQLVGDRFSGISGLSFTIPVAAVFTTAFGLPQVLTGTILWWVLPLAALIALIAPVISFGLEMVALRRMTHSAFGTLLAIEPAFGVLIGLLVLSQSPAPIQVLGIGLVVLAGAAAQRGGTRAAAASPALAPAGDARDGTERDDTDRDVGEDSGEDAGVRGIRTDPPGCGPAPQHAGHHPPPSARDHDPRGARPGPQGEAMPQPTAHSPGYADVADLERYPIHELAGPDGQALVARCRRMLAEEGVCHLPGFVTPAAVAAMVELAGDLLDTAWRSDQTHTVYFEPPAGDVPPTHPRARTVRSAKHGIAYDQIPAEAPLRRLYESDDLTEFIRVVLDKPVLYRSADPLDAFQVTAFLPGEELGWHFDRSEFSVTVMYQPADSGGEFVYAPGLRSEQDPNYAGVQRVLDGDKSGLRILPNAPGTLAFFHGHNALHRVTPVAGGTPRVNSVLTYGEVPDMRLNDLTSLLFYGRTSR